MTSEAALMFVAIYCLPTSYTQPKNCSQEQLQVTNSFEKAAICSWLIREQKKRRTSACDELFTG